MCAFCSGAWDTTALSPRHSNTPSSCLSGNNRMPPSLTRISQILRLPAWSPCSTSGFPTRSEEHTSELQSRLHLVCRLLLEKKKQHIPHHSEFRRCSHRPAKVWDQSVHAHVPNAASTLHIAACMIAMHLSCLELLNSERAHV